jgi:diguanylate cyclase (GGDEF)-like protein
MTDGLRTIHLVTTDDSLEHSTRLVVEKLTGWSFHRVLTVDELLERPPVASDVVLLDKWLRGGNVYETLREVAGRTPGRVFLLCDHADTGEPIARFCGATGVFRRPISTRQLEDALEFPAQPPAPLPSEQRGEFEDLVLPEQLLTDISGRTDENLVSALVDPETSLFNFAFLNYKLDEEFKRAKRFGQPLSCVMLGYEGQVEPLVLSQLAGIFLLASRDTDILGRFDESSFMFLLPQTGGEGARIMARRVAEEAEREGLSDLVGDPIVLSVGIACTPNASILAREDLFREARQAFLNAREKGGGVVASH